MHILDHCLKISIPSFSVSWNMTVLLTQSMHVSFSAGDAIDYQLFVSHVQALLMQVQSNSVAAIF